LGWRPLLKLLACCAREAVGEHFARTEATCDAHTLLPPLVFTLLSFAKHLRNAELCKSIIVLVVVKVDLKSVIDTA
jgi:hypothetical protein